MITDFETWWAENGVKCEVGILEAAFKELAQKAWDAARHPTTENIYSANAMITVPVLGSWQIFKAIRVAQAAGYFDSGIWSAAISAARKERRCTANVSKS